PTPATLRRPPRQHGAPGLDRADGHASGPVVLELDDVSWDDAVVVFVLELTSQRRRHFRPRRIHSVDAAATSENDAGRHAPRPMQWSRWCFTSARDSARTGCSAASGVDAWNR